MLLRGARTIKKSRCFVHNHVNHIYYSNKKYINVSIIKIGGFEPPSYYLVASKIVFILLNFLTWASIISEAKSESTSK